VWKMLPFALIANVVFTSFAILAARTDDTGTGGIFASWRRWRWRRAEPDFPETLIHSAPPIADGTLADHLLMGAEFVVAVQIIVYGGATTVALAFVGSCC